MKKISVISMYYNSRNYGGLLQSYALTKVISKMNNDAEQICFDTSHKKDIKKKRKVELKRICHYVDVIYKVAFYKIKVNLIKKRLCLRNTALRFFCESIPHSKEIYSENNIENSINNYDVFITGSDQVWNMDWYRKEYFLDFVPDDKYKFSYAASMPNVNLSQEKKDIIKNHLKNFDDISAREKVTADFLTELLKRKVEWVLDPTLLLDKVEWDKICSKRMTDDRYIFCYFLGESKTARTCAKKIAQKFNLKIITLPNLNGVLRKVDINFGDSKLYDVSPEQFISLIKYAEYVITDSFHATVFANIYKTRYYVFDRSDVGDMSSRIVSLLSLFESEYRFCINEKANVEYMLTIKDKNVNNTTAEFENMKKKSIDFLIRNIKQAEEGVNCED